MSDSSEQQSLIEYPCAFPIKVMGRAQEDFVQVVRGIAQRHDPAFDDASMEVRSSREGNYLSVTLTIQATSREHLDSVYQDLCDHPMVTMVL